MESKDNKDISIILTSFFMKLAGFWLAADRSEQRRRDFAMIYTILSFSFAMYLLLRDFYFSCSYHHDCLYAASNLLTTAVVLYKVLLLAMYRVKFINLILYTQRHFWHTNYDEHEMKIMGDCKKTCTFFICSFTFFALGTCLAYSSSPIIENRGKNESERMLPFNMWSNLPLTVTPYFEIAFATQVFLIYHVGACYFCFDNFLCIMNIHVSGQFRILQYRLRTLCGIVTDGEEQNQCCDLITLNNTEQCYEAFKNCVRQHQTLIAYCERLEDLFTLIVLGQVLVFSLLICLVGYQILVADGPTLRRYIFIFHLAGTLSQLIMFTYSCDGLIDESGRMATASYSTPWAILTTNKAGCNLRRDVMMMIMRARRTCCITASGFFPVSLETYTAVLSTAMSYFTLLRQTTGSS